MKLLPPHGGVWIVLMMDRWEVVSDSCYGGGSGGAKRTSEEGDSVGIGVSRVH